MTTLFISDLHLEIGRPDITRAFSQFIKEEALNADALYILGDLFEVWIGDDLNNTFTMQILSLLNEVSSAGIPVFLMNGNRDFLIGNVFCKAARCTLLPDPSLITINNELILLCHGDHLCTEDRDYMKFRDMVRGQPWQSQFLGKSIEERLRIASNLREGSQAKKQETNTDIQDVNHSEIIPFMEKFGVRTLIHGHTHRPATHQFDIKNKPAVRIVLGDWFGQISVLRVNNGNYNLESTPFN